MKIRPIKATKLNPILFAAPFELGSKILAIASDSCRPSNYLGPSYQVRSWEQQIRCSKSVLLCDLPMVTEE
jgi:hypothetical protein